jgi:hypothetical protein
MFQRKRPQGSERGSKLEHLSFLIMQLDSIRAFKRVDLAQIEESFAEVGHSRLWDEIRPDLERIVYFPQTIPKALKLMQAAAILRRLFPICLFSIILVVLIRSEFIPIRLSSTAFYFFLILPFAILFAFIYVDLFIRRIIIRYEQEHPNMQSKQKQHIKSVIQKLVTVLVQEIKALNEKPDKYRMKVFYDDYEGIKTVREMRGRLLKRGISTYLVVPLVYE